MHRRHLLLSGLAGLTAGCVGAREDVFTNAESVWPPLGDIVPTKEGKIHAWDRGTGTPVVMIHGASGNLRDFTWSSGKKIANSRRAIAVDRPGFGYSDRVGPNGGDPAVQARALISAVREIGVEKPILIGHSWGAAVAMSWALQDRDNVKGVITISGAVMPWIEKPSLLQWLGIDQLAINTYFNYLQSSAARGGIDRFVNRVFNPQKPPEGYAEYIGGQLALRPESLAANKEDIASINEALIRQSSDYAKLDVPVEVISGTADFIIDPKRQPIPFVERLPNAHLTLLEGIGHMPHHVAPQSVFDALDRLDPDSAKQA